MVVILFEACHSVRWLVGAERIEKLAVVRLTQGEVVIVHKLILKVAACPLPFTLHFDGSFLLQRVVDLFHLLAPTRERIHGISGPGLAGTVRSMVHEAATLSLALEPGLPQMLILHLLEPRLWLACWKSLRHAGRRLLR